MKEGKPGIRATVLQASRRRVVVRDMGRKTYSAVATGRGGDPCVGDEVEVFHRGGNATVGAIVERRNLLLRSYGGKTKNLAANVDRLFVVTAPGSLFNTHFIDRALVAAGAAEIPTSIICNKIDLGITDRTADLLPVYRSVVERLFLVSCRMGEGIEALEEELSNERLRHVVFCGVSGVGKSSLLNRLMPAAFQRVGEVSQKTGQGKQTTSVAVGVLRENRSGAPCIVTDTPGLQHFGLTHLPADGFAAYLPDLWRFGQRCGFRDCRHMVEPSCAVKAALERGDIARSRYESYLHIEHELREAERNAHG